ncbi:hypothetical protein HY418_01710, partial [Candidatus Kaiserbacteria bacterium]|nr:hypothetical protein [Candidatus Kaiserbacteria bacterium]
MNAHSLGITGVSSQSNDFPSTRQPSLTQGEPLFAAIWRLPLGPAFNGYNPVFISFFTTGATPPPSNDYGFIQWKWGVNPGPAPCTLNCYSNVLFIPGIEASRLYRPDGSGGESRIWEPSFTGHDNTQLAMTTSGASVLPDIYTKDVLDRTLGVDVYDSFLSTMRDFSAQNGIQFDTFPYDWRHAADYVAANPAQLATTTIALADKVKALAASSKSGKVTIIAHSNGGLVARSLMAQLGPDAARYVDKLIFVAVPQVGTPQAIAGLLHGYNEAIPVSWAPLLISDSEARTLGSNMPGAYGLLPSAEYFSSVSTPVITFSTSTLPDWVSAYGESINTVAGLDAFLTDNAGRTQPVESDLNDPTILSSGLLSQSQAMHQTIDAWVPPPGVELIQIAGWGIPTTVSGISYGKKNGNIEPAANFTIDGDGTVVVPSALWTSTTTGAE